MKKYLWQDKDHVFVEIETYKNGVSSIAFSSMMKQ